MINYSYLWSVGSVTIVEHGRNLDNSFTNMNFIITMYMYIYIYIVRIKMYLANNVLKTIFIEKLLNCTCTHFLCTFIILKISIVVI